MFEKMKEKVVAFVDEHHVKIILACIAVITALLVTKCC